MSVDIINSCIPIDPSEATIRSLTRSIPTTELKQLAKGGKNFDYAEANYIIDRLNEAFTPMGWSWRCPPDWVLWQPAAVDQVSRQIAVYGEITVNYPWGQVTKGGWGARTVMAVAETTKMEFGDDVKSAASDALKKAATLFGLGNHLSRKGSSDVAEDAKPVLKELKEVYTSKGMTIQEFCDFASGICRKTVLNWGDLSLWQAKAVLTALKDNR